MQRSSRVRSRLKALFVLVGAILAAWMWLHKAPDSLLPDEESVFAQALQRLDLNHDGRVSSDEGQAFGVSQDVFARFDANHDGVWQVGEYRQAFWASDPQVQPSGNMPPTFSLTRPSSLGDVRSQTAPKRPRLVIMLALDTCRADHLGCYGFSKATSPNLDRLARQGVVFEQAFSQANESLFSYASLFTSLYPGRLGALEYDRFSLQPGDTTLAGTLRSVGYNTVGCVAGGHLSHQFGFGRDFDHYDDRSDFGSFYATFPSAVRWLQERNPQQPGFLLLHSYDIHTPYHKPLGFDHLFDRNYQGVADSICQIPEAIENVFDGQYFVDLPTRSMMRPSAKGAPVLDVSMFDRLRQARAAHEPSVPVSARDLEHLQAHYDGGICYADTYVGLLQAQLRALGLERDTLLVILGDHGEDLGEHGFFNHRCGVGDASLHVPLVLWGPDFVPAGRRIADVVQLVDVAPTLLDYLGIPLTQVKLEARREPGGRVLAEEHRLPPDGRSLRPLIEGRPLPVHPAFAEGTLAMATVRTASARLVATGRRVDGYLVGDDLQASYYVVTAGHEQPGEAQGATPRALLQILKAWLDSLHR